jgi:hypothetical protein
MSSHGDQTRRSHRADVVVAITKPKYQEKVSQVSKTETVLTLAQQHRPRLARYAEVLIQGGELLS